MFRRMTMTALYLPLGSKIRGKYGTCGVQRLLRGLSPKKTIDLQMMTYSAPFNKIDNSVSLFYFVQFFIVVVRFEIVWHDPPSSPITRDASVSTTELRKRKVKARAR